MHPADAEACIRSFKRASHARAEFRAECRIPSEQGDYQWFQVHALPELDKDGQIVRWYGTSTNIHDRKRAEATLEHAALHDALTGLANRTMLTKEISRLRTRMQSNPGDHFAVLFIDIDRFKAINDSLGHDLGDRVLVAVSSILSDSVRTNDMVGRLGGDEFVILLSQIDELQTAHKIAERLLANLRAPIYLEERTLYITASLGIAMADAALAPDELLCHADVAMYRAKSHGKNCARLFDGAHFANERSELELQSDLRRALLNGDLIVWYQPIYSISRHEVQGVEALVRWHHPKRGLLSPAQFIPMAEETGMIVDLGRAVLEQACAQVQKWNRQFRRQLTVSVNISARQFSDPHLLDDIRRVLAETGLNPHLLKLEITESVMLRDPALAEHTLNEARSMGIEICLDDFGTGYSSLSYLLDFPFDTVKIDRSFVREIDINSARSEVVRTVVQLANNLHKCVIAEGVETEGELEHLTRMSCDLAQGYLLSKPLAPEMMMSMLESQRLLAETQPLAQFANVM